MADYLNYGTPASYQSATGSRADFIVRTYVHLLIAILAFVFVEVCLFYSGIAHSLTMALGGGRATWLLILGGFLVLSWIATSVANTSMSLGAQYAALAAYIVGQALIFCPLLYIANFHYDGVIQSAAMATLAGFTLLTAVVVYTRRDFSWMRSMLIWASICAMLLIVAAVIWGFTLGPVFSVAMIAVAGGAILYDTSRVLYHYDDDRHVAASLALFASVALLFWYVLRLMMQLRR